MDKNEVFENHCFILIKRFWMVVCMWPYQNKTLKFYGRMTFLPYLLTSLHDSQFILSYRYISTALLRKAFASSKMIKFYEELYEENRNGQIFIENFVSFLYVQSIFAKIYMSVSKEKKLQHLFEMMTRDYKKIQVPEERAAMEKLWNTARILCIAYSFYMFTALYAFVFTPQVVPAIFDVIWSLNESQHKMICYYAEYFVDQEEYLYIIVLHSFVVMAITVFANVAVDTSYFTATYHVLGLFSLLRCRLKHLSEWADGNVNREDERLHRFMIDTIKIHNKVLEIAELVRTTYDACNLILLGLTLLVLSIGFIDVILNLKTPELILRNGFGFVGIIVYLFFVDWPGQKLLDSSDELAESIYYCHWYNLPKRTQFLMRFMMMRCLIPCQLTAGTLFQMNFTFCGSVSRKALSFFMVAYSFS